MSVLHNIQPAFAVYDATLLENDLNTCHLLVMVGQGTFSYVVFDPLTNRFLALKSYNFQPQKLAVADLEMIEQVFDADKLHQKQSWRFIPIERRWEVVPDLAPFEAVVAATARPGVGAVPASPQR